MRNPCKNGATCVNSVGGYSCQCPANYKGKHCDEGNTGINFFPKKNSKVIETVDLLQLLHNIK